MSTLAVLAVSIVFFFQYQNMIVVGFHFLYDRPLIANKFVVPAAVVVTLKSNLLKVMLEQNSEFFGERTKMMYAIFQAPFI